MMKFSKLAVSAAVLIALNGCLEVEDDSNDEVVAALEEQNLALEANKTPVTLFGTVVDAGTNQAITEATVTMKVGSAWQAPVSVSGEFSIPELPANTDVVILVQSPSGAFMDRVFYGKTVSVGAGQVAEQSMGELQVSEAVVKTYSVLDSETSESFAGLIFQYNTASVFSSGFQMSGASAYQVESTYDDTTELYSITLPKDLAFQVTASGDLDGDGITDFVTEQASFWAYDKVSLSADEAMQLEVLYVNETEEYQPVELRMTVIDNFGERIEGIEMTASDRFLGQFSTSYDADTQEYVFNYQTSSRVDLIMPSFTTDDEVTYQSGQLTLSWASAESLTISDYGFQNNLPSDIEVVAGVASIIIQPRETNVSSSYVGRVSSQINENENHSLNQFYQSAISLLDDSVSLTQRNVFKVIKGNDSDNDLVPAGTTRVGSVFEEIPATASLSHNNTFLTVTANTNLTGGTYSYEIDKLVNAQTGEEFNTNFHVNFEIEEDELTVGTFDINDIKLDNNNGTTNGALIVTQNTAGEASTSTDINRHSNLYFPLSILSLDYLELNRVSYISNGNPVDSPRQIKVIVDGEPVTSARNLVSLATNENVESHNGYSAQADTQTSLADGKWYYTNSGGFYSNDNSGSEVNSATFTYIYRVKGEDIVHEGTITLPVL